jgi:hypothetical protein
MQLQASLQAMQHAQNSGMPLSPQQKQQRLSAFGGSLSNPAQTTTTSPQQQPVVKFSIAVRPNNDNSSHVPLSATASLLSPRMANQRERGVVTFGSATNMRPNPNNNNNTNSNANTENIPVQSTTGPTSTATTPSSSTGSTKPPSNLSNVSARDVSKTGKDGAKDAKNKDGMVWRDPLCFIHVFGRVIYLLACLRF